MTNGNPHPLDQTLARWQLLAIVVAVVGCALCGVAAWWDLVQFWRSYLLGFLYWWEISIGCLGLLMLYYLVGGRWGAAVRPLLECGGLLVVLMAIFFVPVALSVNSIYPWAAGDVSGEAMSPQKALYLSPVFFYGRAIGYFVVWAILAWLIAGRRSTSATDFPTSRTRISAGGLVILFLTVTFAAIDWAMSLDPKWFSSIYGALIAMGGALAAMSLATATLAASHWKQPNEQLVTPHTLGDLASLILSFLMLWAYFGFSQYLIIWSGNLPEENVWYVNRLSGNWQWVALAIVLLHFALPFFLLLSQDLKRSPRPLAGVAALIVVMQFVYLWWTITPSFHPRQLVIPWPDAVVPVTIGGWWVAAYLWLARRRLTDILVVRQS